MFQEGETYIICLPFGWVLVGRYAGQAGLCHGWFDDPAFIRRAIVNYGEFVSNGPPKEAEFRPFGRRMRVNIVNTLWDGPFPFPLPYANGKKK